MGARHGTSADGTVEEEKKFPGNPLATFSQIAKRSPASFGDLKEALKHFYKFQKNSPKLPLSFRSFTKIGVAN